MEGTLGLQAADLAPLFEPVEVGGRMLRNRLVMSPMTREAATDGVLPARSVEYYASRARGGVGLVVTEATTIDHEVAHYSTREPYMFGEAAIAAWRPVVEAVHAAGAAIYPQLWHTGVSRKRRQTHNPDAPSLSASEVSSAGLAGGDDSGFDRVRGGTPARAATDADIEAVVKAFGQAAYEAQALGFDGVAIHGAHGYLLYQFYWERSNLRQDGYGGDLERRARLSNEVVREIRRRVGPDFPIMFRFSQWSGWDYGAKLARSPRELEALLTPLVDAGVDIFDASTRRFWLPEFEGDDLNLAGWAKRITGKLAMTVGSVGLEAPLGDPATAKSGASATTENLRELMARLRHGEFDLVGVGRALLANPDWSEIVRQGRWQDLRPYEAAMGRDG